METHATTWYSFIGIVATLLAIDLFVIGRGEGGAMSMKTAVRWSSTVVIAALLFGGHIYFAEGARTAAEYYAGYLIELSLSVDNLFVFLLLFQYFAVPAAAQPRVLMWGVLSAMVMRGIMIAAGVLLLERFNWLIYLLGAVLVLTGIKMFRQAEVKVEPDKNPLVRLARRVFPISDEYDGKHFVTKIGAKTMLTPLLLVLLVVEWTDLVFAIDSIPAIFSVTKDPFIVYSSNIFAIMGLRAMFFVLADAMDRFVYLKPGVALILAFVGLKMVLSGWVHTPIGVSLAVILTVLAGSILLSAIKIRRERTT